MLIVKEHGGHIEGFLSKYVDIIVLDEVSDMAEGKGLARNPSRSAQLCCKAQQTQKKPPPIVDFAKI